MFEEGTRSWLTSGIRQDAKYAIRIKLLPALAFSTADEVPQLFSLVAEQLLIPESRDVILYFENTYIGRVLPGGGVQAHLFPFSIELLPRDTLALP